jgi:hypothetical protein
MRQYVTRRAIAAATLAPIATSAIIATAFPSAADDGLRPLLQAFGIGEAGRPQRH